METIMKVKGVAKRDVQEFLKKVQTGKDEIRQVQISRTTVLIEDITMQSIPIGTIRTSDAKFLESLHSYRLEPVVTGGGWLILNENKHVEKTVHSFDELREDELMCVLNGQWKAQKKNFGLLLKTL